MVTSSFPANLKLTRPPGKVSVVLVEDSEFVRSIWHKTIDRIGGLAVSGSFGSIDEAVAYIRTNPPQIVLLDLEINGKSGLEVLRFVTAQYPLIKVFVVTNHAEPMYRTFCLDAGASAFFEKGTQFAELVSALEACVGSGNDYPMAQAF